MLRLGVGASRCGASFAGDGVQAGGWRLDVLWPRANQPPPEDPNDASLVMRASATGVAALLTADAESGVLGGSRLNAWTCSRSRTMDRRTPGSRICFAGCDRASP